MKVFKKHDIIIFISILVLTLVGSAIIWARPYEGEKTVAIYINGEFMDRYSLEDGYYSELPIETVYGRNKLVISEGMAWVEDSDCANRICVRQGQISQPGDIIICAPHRLVIKVEAVNEE